ncbi:MAG: hypothetical protein ACR2QQ_01040 [Gammaproteobacteria bacterium]
MTVSVVIAFAAQAQDEESLSPASLGSGENSLSALLRTPFERPPGSYDVALRCQVIVEPDGSTRFPKCLTIDRYSVFREEAERALASATMVPARIEGEPVRVLMNLIIGYRCSQTCPAFLFTNHGRNNQEFGFSYSAPQPILDDSVWYSGFEDKLSWAESELSPTEVGGIRYIVSARVSESGRVSRERVDSEYPEPSGLSYTDAAERAADTLGATRFIPGFAAGAPASMRIFEYWIDPDGVSREILKVPIRVHVLWSDLVPALDSTLSEERIREMFVVANEYWQPAAIEWEIDSIVSTQAERQLAFRRAVVADPTGSSPGDEATYAQICPNENWRQPGWNVCFARALPRSAMYFDATGAAYLGELDVAGTEIPPFALAHVLGHMMGLRDAQRCSGTFMRYFEGEPPDSNCSSPLPMDFSDDQIRRARSQARTGRPPIDSGIGRGRGGMRR